MIAPGRCRPCARRLLLACPLYGPIRRVPVWRVCGAAPNTAPTGAWASRASALDSTTLYQCCAPAPQPLRPQAGGQAGAAGWQHWRGCEACARADLNGDPGALSPAATLLTACCWLTSDTGLQVQGGSTGQAQTNLDKGGDPACLSQVLMVPKQRPLLWYVHHPRT